jgi:hypothetical protein
MSRTALAVATLLLTVSLAACGGSSPAAADGSASTLVPAGTVLSVDEATVADIVFLREEEKLARDVYAVLGQKWALQIFANIQVSEQRHMDAVLLLLQAADVADPAAGEGAGEFTDPELASLYATLVARGATSPLDALVVGATIEDYDLADLAASAAVATDPTVLAVYANLTKGSRNHLRSFVSQIAAAGGSYAPQFIDAATYQSIVSSPMERGP